MATKSTQDQKSQLELSRCLVVALSSGPVVVLAHECPTQSVELAGQRYHASEFGEFTGFYDWLRDGTGKVLGVRYWPFETTEFLCEALASLPYVVVAVDRTYVEIYFAEERDIDAERSSDQDFGTSRLFSADGGAWALALDTAALSPAERLQVAALAADPEPAGARDTL